MGVFSAATRSPRVASLEASKQIQKDSARRRRGPKARNAKNEIEDTIIVATPGLRAEHISLQERGLSSIVTSVCIPLSPTSPSPSPKKRKAEAFDYGADLPTTTTKRDSSIARDESPGLGGPENWTPPATPQEAVSSYADFDSEVHDHQGSRTVDASTTWTNPSATRIGLTDEDTYNGSLTASVATVTERSLAPDSSPDHLRWEAVNSQTHPTLLVKRRKGSNAEHQARGMVTAQKREQANSSDDDRGTLVVVTPQLRGVNPNTSAETVPEAALAMSPPMLQLIIDISTPAATSPPPHRRAITPLEDDVNVRCPLLHSREAELEDPVANNIAVDEKLGQDHVPRDGAASTIVGGQEPPTPSPELRGEDVIPADEVSEELDNRGDEMDGIECPEQAQTATSASSENSDCEMIEKHQIDTASVPKTIAERAEEAEDDAIQECLAQVDAPAPAAGDGPHESDHQPSDFAPQSPAKTSEHNNQISAPPESAVDSPAPLRARAPFNTMPPPERPIKPPSPPPRPRAPVNTMPPPPLPPSGTYRTRRTTNPRPISQLISRHNKPPPPTLTVKRRARITIAELLN